MNFNEIINIIFYVYFALNVIMAIAFAVIVPKVKADEKGKAFVTLISLLFVNFEYILYIELFSKKYLNLPFMIISAVYTVIFDGFLIFLVIKYKNGFRKLLIKYKNGFRK